MKRTLYIAAFITASLVGCKKQTDDFLEKLPPDQLTDQSYWTSESNVRTFAWGFYPTYFVGYASGFDLSWGGYFSGESLNDDFAPTTPTPYAKNVPATGGGWAFTSIRKANLFINRVATVPMGDEAVRNWVGIGRFFRAMEYANKVRAFGDYPWIGYVPLETDTTLLYKPRDPRTLVMDSVLLDFKYAADNVRATDAATGPQGLIVNKWVVLAYMSRVFLNEGAWQKYHFNNTAKANEYFEAAKFAANEIMTKSTHGVAADYRKLFNSLDLNANTEIIMYRKYQSGLLTHSLNSYVNKEAQTGTSKSAIETYLSKDGLPIGLSPLYKGDKTITDVFTDRDPRLAATIVPAVRLNGVVSNYSTSGYAVLKFFNEDIKDLPNGNSSLNDTHAPVIRFGEVLMNYAEACTELGTLTQADLDKSINRLRKRTVATTIPNLQVMGGQPAVNGVVYDDPKRDPTVSSLLWEVRRERRIELMMEGFRNEDLRRWKKLDYTDTQKYPDINKGAWVKKSNYPATLVVTLENNAAEGYVVPAPKLETQRVFTDTKIYLNPLPLDQIKLYKDHGVDLKQNPGW